MVIESELGRAVMEAIEPYTQQRRTADGHTTVLSDRIDRQDLGARLIRELAYLGYKIEREHAG